MKVAILSDIHANIFALDEVMRYCSDNGINSYWWLGDYIGYYFYPKSTLDKIRDTNGIYIKGNHEDIYLETLSNKEKLIHYTNFYGECFELCHCELNELDTEWIQKLPYTVCLNVKGYRILLKHSNHLNWKEYYYNDTSEEKFKNLVDGEYDFIFIGHSHYSFIKNINNTNIVNVGSVGQNRKQGGVAEFAVLDLENGKIELKQLNYDVGQVLNDSKYKNVASDSYLTKVLKR